jgi:uncharacterized protein YbaR (Trm112 family)
VIDKDLLDILACPETHQSLREASDALLERVNGDVASKSARTVGGVVVDEPLESGLVREDGRVIYPVREGIPVLLVEEGIALDPPAPA